MTIQEMENITFLSCKRNDRSDLIALFVISKEQFNKLNTNVPDSDASLLKNWWTFDKKVFDLETEEELTERLYYLKFRCPKIPLDAFEQGDTCNITMEVKKYAFVPKNESREIKGYTTKLYSCRKSSA